MQTFSVKVYFVQPDKTFVADFVELPASFCMPSLLSDLAEFFHASFVICDDKYVCRQFLPSGK